ITKSHAWRFFADGARQPASAIRFRSSSDTGSDVYSRTLRRAVIAPQLSNSPLLEAAQLFLKSNQLHGSERQRDRRPLPTILPPHSSDIPASFEVVMPSPAGKISGRPAQLVF